MDELLTSLIYTCGCQSDSNQPLQIFLFEIVFTVPVECSCNLTTDISVDGVLKMPAIPGEFKFAWNSHALNTIGHRVDPKKTFPHIIARFRRMSRQNVVEAGHCIDSLHAVKIFFFRKHIFLPFSGTMVEPGSPLRG